MVWFWSFHIIFIVSLGGNVSVVSFWSFRFGCFKWFRFGRFARMGGFVLVVSFRFGFGTCPVDETESS